jgi:AbiU2
VQTNDEVRDEYVQVMGPDLGNYYHELRNQFEWLRHKWNEFQELFERGPERIELLNTVASNFFYFLQKLMYEDAMLHLSRLTDPPKTKVGGQQCENLTVMGLAEKISVPSLKAKVQVEAEKVWTNCDFARDWRNKQLAHTDLATLRTSNAILPGVDSAKIKDALKSMHTLLSHVEEYYHRPPIAFLADPWGAESLVHYLEATRPHAPK